MEKKNDCKKTDCDCPTCAFSLKDRYELLIKARNFHYENYSKWMTYFYVAIGAMFVAYYHISGENKDDNTTFLQYSLLILGYILSILWYWSSKGYYYWNINFISMVNYYETKVFNWPKENRVYMVFYDKNLQNEYGNPLGGANISTSKIAIFFAYIISNFWGFLFFYFTLSSYNCNQAIQIIFSIISTFVFVFILSVIIAKNLFFSKNDDFESIIE